MPRQRTVFGSHSNLAHVWAQQTYPFGKSSDGRMLFEGSTIYSYGKHYAIATFTDAYVKGERVVLFNSAGYSVSTAKHRQEASRALRGLSVHCFTVPWVASNTKHAANLEHLVAQFDAAAAKAAKPYAQTWRAVGVRLRDLEKLWGTVQDYAGAFDLPSPLPRETLNARCDAVREAFARYNDPAAVAKRERAQAKAQERKEAAHYRLIARARAYIEGVGPRLSNDDYRTLSNAACPTAGEYYAAVNRNEPKLQSGITPAQWVNGHGNSTALPYGGETYCRRVGERLETSLGAVVPWGHAVAVFLRAQRCRQLGTAWHRNGDHMRVGPFELDYIDTEGNIRAGCHAIQWGEMLRLALREIPHLVQPSYPVPALCAA
jgi:hypothetical protein